MSLPQSAAPEVEQRHGEWPPLGTELPVTGQHVHLAVVDNTGATRRHPRGADLARNLGSALHQPEDLVVQRIDLAAQRVRVRSVLGVVILGLHCDSFSTGSSSGASP